MYLLYYANNLLEEKDKVLYIANLLKGSIFEWFEPRIRDYLENDEEDRETTTDKLFANYTYFTNKLKVVFGEVDE